MFRWRLENFSAGKISGKNSAKEKYREKRELREGQAEVVEEAFGGGGMSFIRSVLFTNNVT